MGGQKERWRAKAMTWRYAQHNGEGDTRTQLALGLKPGQTDSNKEGPRKIIAYRVAILRRAALYTQHNTHNRLPRQTHIKKCSKQRRIIIQNFPDLPLCAWYPNSIPVCPSNSFAHCTNSTRQTGGDLTENRQGNGRASTNKRM